MAEELNEALKSLGLHGRRTELRGGSVKEDKLGGLRDAGRFDPPADWAEQFRAFERGKAGARP